jgi:hypothetical protein
MPELNEPINYVNDEILSSIESDFDLIEQRNWYKLYQHKINKSFWRLDEWDKYQDQFFVRLESLENWFEQDDRELRMEWLKKFRGTTKSKCIWKGCDNLALKELTMCEYHAYLEMGIRR